MSAPKILIAAVVAAILSTLACAFPSHINTNLNDVSKKQPSIREKSLKDVLINKTLCPIMVDYDVQDDRVPRRIKVLKCAKQPSHCSSTFNSTSIKDTTHECCTHKDDLHHLECVEIQDIITVTYKTNLTNLIEIPVPVGCTCMIQDKIRATAQSGH